MKEERFADGSVLFATSLGRILFNDTLPVDYPFINEQAPKGKLSKIVDDIATRYSTQQVAATLDALKDLGFTRAPWSGVTMAFSDIVAPPDREEIIKGYEAQAAKVNNQYDLACSPRRSAVRSSSTCGPSAPTRSPKPCARTSMTTTT